MNDDWSGNWSDDNSNTKGDTWSDDEDVVTPKKSVTKKSSSRTSKNDDWNSDWDASAPTNTKTSKEDWDDNWSTTPQQTKSLGSSRSSKSPAKSAADWASDNSSNATPASNKQGDWDDVSSEVTGQLPSIKPVATIQPRKTGRHRVVEPMPDAFAIRSTRSRGRGSGRRPADDDEEIEEDDTVVKVMQADDDILGLSPHKPHQRQRLDASLMEFEDNVPHEVVHEVKEEEGSFWDDNEGVDEEKEDQPEIRSTGRKKKIVTDKLLDGLGDLLSIKISDTVHDNVRKGAESVRSIGTSLWSGFTSLLGEEYSLKMTFNFNGKQYQAKKKVAEGGFAVIYMAIDADGHEYAVKVMNGGTPDIVKEIEREVKLLKALKHPNIMPALGFSKQIPESGPEQYILLTPFYKNGSVWDEIEKFNADPIRVWPFTEERCLRIFIQTCTAVKVLHDKGMVHRDIKPHNIMLDKVNGREKAILIDFGSAARLDLPVQDRRDAYNIKEDAEKHCSAAYRAPELYDPRPGMNIDGGVDIWALGCTLYAMAFGTCPFESPLEGIMKLAILDGKISFPKNNTFRCCTFSNPFCKFIRFMLRVNIDERITIDDCIEKANLLLERCPKSETF